MLFLVDPYASEEEYYDPEDAYVEFKRREYIAALQEKQQRDQFRRELALEEQRHRLALASIAQQEETRRQRLQQQHQRQQRRKANLPPHEPRRVTRPSPEEIVRRRQALQEDEEQRSRDIHKQILSQIFGVSFDEPQAESAKRDDSQPEKTQPEASSISADKPKPQAKVPKQARTAKVPEPSKSPAASKASQSKQGTLPKPQAKVPKQARTAKVPEPGESPAAAKASQSKQEILPAKPSADTEAEPHWSAAPDRARALAEITSLGRTFTALKNTFVFPSGPLERLPGSDGPRLAYNSTNTTIHAYEHALSELLTKLDNIESHGFSGVREARKQLVVSIEKELEALEKQVAERLASVTSPAAAPSTLPEVHVPTEGASEEMEVDKPATANVAETSQEPTAVEQQDKTTKPITTTSPDESDTIKVTGYDVKSEQTERPGPTGEDSKEHDRDAPMEQSQNPGLTSAAEEENLPDAPNSTEAVTSGAEPAQPPPPSSPAARDVSDEDSEIEDAVEITMEPQRTVVPLDSVMREAEYELV